MTDRPDDRRDEELSGGQPLPGDAGQPSTPGQGTEEASQPGPAAGQPSSSGYDPKYDKPDYRLRLMALRDKVLRLHGQLVVIIQIIVAMIVMYVVYYVANFMMMFGILGSSFATGNFNSSSGGPYEYLMAFLPFAGMALGLIVGAVVAFSIAGSIRRWVESMHVTRYKLSESYLYHTDFLRVVAEEDFTHIIIDAVNEIPSLKWISPARPKTLENQLEFSACYWNSVLQLSYGPGRLDNASLFNGSWNFQVSRISLYTCCVCCCLSNSLSVFTLPILLITANYHMYRVARTVCIIDYLVDDKFATSAAQEIPQAG
ncbi:ammonium transporter [bacterium]|nr:ammonium transporter [bacterium]